MSKTLLYLADGVTVALLLDLLGGCANGDLYVIAEEDGCVVIREQDGHR